MMMIRTITSVAACITALAACGPDAQLDLLERAGQVSPEHRAPAWLVSVAGHGTWTDKASPKVVRAWVDARVNNRRFHKRVFVELTAPHGKATMRTLHRAWYKGGAGNGFERWGTDTLEIYPTGGPLGAQLSGQVLFRLRLQEDPDGDGQDQAVVTPWQPLYGSGQAVAPASDPWAPGLSSPLRPVTQAAAPRVYFTPFEDAGRAVVQEIKKVTQAKQQDPAGRHTIHAAIYNINDWRITDALIQAHQAGVELRLLIDGRKLRPSATWQTEDDRLLAAGVPLCGVRYRGRGAMHMKFALFDGRRLATGSFNWELGSSTENHENMVLTDAPELVAAYARRFVALAGDALKQRQVAHHPGATRSVSFAPDEAPYRVVGRLLDRAKKHVWLAMFTAKDVKYREDGKQTSLFLKLRDAVKRGVKVTMITDHGIAEGGDYFGTLYPDDPADEWLETLGVRVVRADNPFGPYASMHHKFVVIDDALVVTGAFNWYNDAAFLNDEDQLVWRDKTLAARFNGEFVDLLRRYDKGFVPAAWPQVTVRFAVTQAQTSWGDGVALVGDLPALGGWAPQQGLQLSGASWPVWTGQVSLPAGVRAQYKIVTRHSGGGVTWQGGQNRRFAVPTDRAAHTVTTAW